MKLSSGAAAIVAGTVAALVPPILVLGFDQPAGLGLGLGFGIGGALFGLLGLGRGSGGAGRVEDGRNATARELIAEGQAALERLRRTGRAVRDELMREEIKLLTMKADRVIREAQADPSTAMQVRRLFTFYLPNAASVAEGWRVLEDKPEREPELAGQARETVAALNDAFSKFADDMHEPKLQTLDLDLRVLNNALKQDLEGTR
ncbi:MAG TPA: 5-bromo-4-chloroindolyl phosphate hydrolysis family protein [Caulobacteraceae bacterium]|jgi:hypothetical protein